eukprot:TRINITY_DN485_c0_g1_i1.p1 TRINITY_DN485_c0_g1~~TRINITY_DN485_c0_g1_i1.p1  ORF type:complete len:233 (-),score=48.87 TRINITY_DN485_c0_g1_i1:140-838(-)
MNSILTYSSSAFSSSTKSGSIEYFVEDVMVEDEEDFNDSDENGNCALIFAASQGRDDLVRSLVDQGALVNHQNFLGETSAYWAAAHGHENVVDILIENGANLNISNLDGVSPAHIAAANGHVSILAKLIRNGAYINAQDEDRDTPLHYAVREGKAEAVEFLVRSCNARTDIKNEDAESPLDLARCLEHCCSANYAAIIQVLEQHAQKQSPFKSFPVEASFLFGPNKSANLVC